MNSGTGRFGAVIAVVVIIALLAGTWFLGIGPRLSEAAAADDEREGVELVNRGHESALERLRELNDDLPALKDQLDGLRAAFPAESEFSEYYREVEAIGAASGVLVSIVGFEGPDKYEPLEVPEAEIDELQAARDSISPDNFLTMSVTVHVAGTYEGVMDAISRMQATRRYVLVHDVQLERGLVAGDQAAVALVTGQIYILRDSAPAPAEPVASD